MLVTADEVARGKPAPDPYLLAAARLGVDPGACLVFEDAPAGIAAGRAAGMTVWAVTTTHAPGELDSAGASTHRRRAARASGGAPPVLSRPVRSTEFPVVVQPQEEAQ